MDHKTKKQVILARNKRNQRIFQHARQHKAEHERILEEQQALMEQPAAPAAPQEEIWSARAQEIRDKLTNKKRMSKDRWNRFAGTSGAGAMGR